MLSKISRQLVSEASRRGCRMDPDRAENVITPTSLVHAWRSAESFHPSDTHNLLCSISGDSETHRQTDRQTDRLDRSHNIFPCRE